MNKKIELLVIGGSAGSFDVLLQVIPKIKSDINFPIIIILHRKSNTPTSIAKIFSSKTNLPVIECEEKEILQPGTIYFSPPDYHLLVENDHSVSLDSSEKVNYSRPSIDVTFKNLADLYHENLAAILLSGANSDGAKGLFYIKRNNGITIVQDPAVAEIKFMPQQAINLFEVDHIFNIEEIINYINNINTTLN
ncbi:chemotaxis protein CheB [Pedobacter cryophilus]|uniref:protein-glutamate methylesterase n=1 Tax=Pedobacter cryophilus TaxID=2571271 RepID=A0A4U1BZ65_9SPHI|nr:chemotaxis protein CheB [Pedobacter cryophilus]TKB98558.1 chemotaxis protein CheB [Pedobacter cryophilus]